MINISDLENEINTLERKVRKYTQQLWQAQEKLKKELEKQETPKVKETTNYGTKKKQVRPKDSIETSGSFTSKL